jgi:hypothetical protein
VVADLSRRRDRRQAQIPVAELGQLAGQEARHPGPAAHRAVVSRQRRTDRQDRYETVDRASQRLIAPFRLDPSAGSVMIFGYMGADWGICYGRGID